MQNLGMKKSMPIIALALVVGAASFYGGMRYDQGRASSQAGAGRGNFAAGEGPQGGGFSGGRRGGVAGGFVSGEAIAKDTTSITVKMRDGGSKIVFLSDSTPVMKSVSGTSNDIASGTQVMVMGVANSDGSVTAQTVRINQ